MLLILLASGLRRRKRRAWQLALAGSLVLALSHLGLQHVFGAGLVSVALAGTLIANRRYFVALLDPVTGKWRAVRVFVQLTLAGLVINFGLLSFAPAPCWTRWTAAAGWRSLGWP